MCTVIPKSKKGHPLTAKEDIEVYKSCDINSKEEGKVKSLYTGFEYTQGKLYTSKFDYDVEQIWYDRDEFEYMKSLRDKGIVPCYVRKGFHALLEYDPENDRLCESTHPAAVVCIFIIPKGAKYYKNEAGCIVSNQIIFKEVLK